NVNTRSQIPITTSELFPENNANRLPSINLSGAAATVTTIQVFNIEYFNNSITDTVTYQRGSHGYKLGFLTTFRQKNENANNNRQGSFVFATGGGRTAFQNFMTGNRDGLCGTPCTYSEAQLDVTNHLRWKRFEGFAQDTWRIRTNVTLDYGVRYGLYPGVIDKNNVLSTFDPSRYDPAFAPVCANAACSAVVTGSGDFLKSGLLVAGVNSPF